jgi:hypothetical protein
MSKIVPTIGRVVLYTLTADDAEKINRRRTTGQSIAERIKAALWPIGAQAHIGNSVSGGMVFPATVVRTWGDTPESVVNLQVYMDGNDIFWVTSAHVSEGPEPGFYHWMGYQLGQAKANS